MFRSALKTSSLLLIPRRNAGHSKWANIKHTKGLKDSQRAEMFTKLYQKMRIAIKDGGSANPDSNLLLAQTIETARKMNMPNASIENCIKSAMTDKSSSQSYWYEVKGPSSSFIIIQALTESPRRTRDTIAPILKKHKASFADRACKHIFLHKGEIIASPPPDIANVEETVIDHAIECGAEEVFPCENEEGSYMFICDQEALKKVNTKLQALNYNVKSAEFNFIPTMKVSLSDSDMELMSKLITKLEEHPDVVVLYDNVM